jgi:hypothetical protein
LDFDRYGFIHDPAGAERYDHFEFSAGHAVKLEENSGKALTATKRRHEIALIHGQEYHHEEII